MELAHLDAPGFSGLLVGSIVEETNMSSVELGLAWSAWVACCFAEWVNLEPVM
jgi:hypothetical protein